MYGLDLLGLAQYPDVALKNFPHGWALGCFSSTFGDARPAVASILKAGKCAQVRVQLAWHDNHHFTPADFPKIRDEAKKWCKLVAANPHVDWYFSGACEHDMGAKEALKLANIVQDTIANCTYVDNPMRQGSYNLIAANVLAERHGSEATPPYETFWYSFSFDGSSCVDANVTEIKLRLSSATLFMFWVPQFNGRKGVNDTTPRALREAWPSGDLIRSVAFLATERGEVKLPASWLLKSHAEDVGGTRANKPVFIMPFSTKQITLKCNGKVLLTCPLYGSYAGGGYRYYSPEWGYRTAERAIALSGSPVVEVWANRRKWGTVNMAFRQGRFR